MDKDNLKKELEKLLKDKKISMLITIALILGFVLVAINYFVPSLTASNKSTNQEVTDTNSTKAKVEENYKQQQEKTLKTTLEAINGVGKVQVTINFQSGEVKVPAYDTSSQTSTTEETDSNGGKRVNKQQNDGSTVVMTTNNGSNEPFILETYNPKVVGVIVVAEGASDGKTKSNIQQAIMSLYDIGANKVQVYPMGK